jgi:hypothetical protein
MSIKTIFAGAVLLLAAGFGVVQDVTLPGWAWVIWGVLFLVAVTGWIVVSNAVELMVRKTILLIPIARKLPETGDKLNIPVSQIHASKERIEAEIRRLIPVRPVAWLAVKAFQMKADDFMGGILDHCKVNNSDVFTERLMVTWLHEKVAGTIAGAAAEVVSGFWMIATIALACIGVVFALPYFR